MMKNIRANQMCGQWASFFLNAYSDKVKILLNPILAPWTGRSIVELLKNINNQKLSFNKNGIKCSE